ncbi:hypothetical protein KP509_04G084700 [Ceratopteris richardii]|uniref:Uncharacterized protein n=1 Tax=Ceratopteris richardii TaxID=49495 RepID=A0A8T2V192_CERRI|nr:hypothetical protein KP509_04G084700 [Ceratopteris richardii]
MGKIILTEQLYLHCALHQFMNRWRLYGADGNLVLYILSLM